MIYQIKLDDGRWITVAEVIYKAWTGKKRADYAYNDYMRLE